jgi:hypothetical protein
MNVVEISIGLTGGGTSQKLAISTTTAASAAAAALSSENKGAPIKYLITPDVECFVRKGTGTVEAVADGTDQILIASQTYRVELMDGEKMAFITATGSGNVYITPRA